MPRLETSSRRSLLQRGKSLPQDVLRRYHKLGSRSKMVFWGVVVLNIILIALVIIITPTRIMHWFNLLAQRIERMGVAGMFLCALFVIMASHPPLFGFAGSMTLIGFVYGIWPGFLIAFIASMTGAGVAFLSVRAFFTTWIRRYSNPQWDAFGHVMAAKGTPLVIMIRYCPLPWALANGLFASIESVKFWQYMLANLLIQPRLMIPVFIGSRLTSLTEENPTHDPYRFWLNLASIGLSSTISIFTGIVIYRLTLAQMKKVGGGDGELAAEILEEGRLLGDWSDEGDGDGEAEALTERVGSGSRAGGGDGLGPLRRSSSRSSNQ